VDRRGEEFHSLLRGYLTERERCSVNLEDMLKKQIINQDQFRDPRRDFWAGGEG
jgi:hypothetical protein